MSNFLPTDEIPVTSFMRVGAGRFSAIYSNGTYRIEKGYDSFWSIHRESDNYLIGCPPSFKLAKIVADRFAAENA